MTIERQKSGLTIVAVGGFASNSGKTTLLCELLRSFPGWEAIKVTRGHYRSCGKDPEACCVSHLLGDAPLVRSGRAETYSPGKDTGRYWDAGAANVHWVIATDGQIEDGIARALSRVESPGVFLEGNSYLQYVDVDFTVMVARDRRQKIKPTARRVLAKTTALYLSGAEPFPAEDVGEGLPSDDRSINSATDIPVYTPATIAQLITRIRGTHCGQGEPLSEAALANLR